MDLKATIEQLSQMAGRAIGKAETVIESAKEADKAADARGKAKNANDFEKHKKACLASIAEAEKGLKGWQTSIDAWEQTIAGLEKQISAEQDAIAQKVKEADAVNKLIDEANAKIKAYNKDLLLGESDPRAKPYIERSNAVSKLSGVTAALVEVMVVVTKARKTWNDHNVWGAEMAAEFKRMKDVESKAKFKAPK